MRPLTPKDKQFVVGTVVYLRSGSPKMTVIKTVYTNRKSDVTCQWIAYGTTELQTATFPHSAVRRTKQYISPNESRPRSDLDDEDFF